MRKLNNKAESHIENEAYNDFIDLYTEHFYEDEELSAFDQYCDELWYDELEELSAMKASRHSQQTINGDSL